jgi:hypothetical protein
MDIADDEPRLIGARGGRSQESCGKSEKRDDPG